MPRPSRTKVASTNARVVTSSSIPTTDDLAKSMDSTTPVALQKTKKRRKAVENIVEDIAPAAEEVASNVEKPTTTTNVRPRGRFAAKKVASDEGQRGALDALRARRDAALKAKNAKSYPAQATSLNASVPPTATEEEVHWPTTLTSARTTRTSSAIKLTKAVVEHARREHTPAAVQDSDDDLYGLSPGGEVSRMRLEMRRLSTQHQAPPSALKAQGTPAVETSILALANFTRRARQPSIIRMVQQTSELGNHSDFETQLDDTLRDFDEFNPDDESTPLHLNKRKSAGLSASKTQAEEPSTSSSRKRKHTDEGSEIQVRRSPSLASSPPPNLLRKRSDENSIASSSLPDYVVPSTEQFANPEAEPGIYSDTMAPPRSSSDFSSPAKSRDVPSARTDKRRKTNASGVVQEGHPEPASTRKKKSKRATAISTATLQSLLPKARHTKRSTAKIDTYDIPSSDPIDTSMPLGSEDDDELAEVSSRRKRGTMTTIKTPIRNTNGNKGKKKKSTTAPGASRKPVKTNDVTPKEKSRRTYGRVQPAESEKENNDVTIISDDNSDSSDDEAGARRKRKDLRDSGVAIDGSKELQDARKKFEEVDQWEMEFESVDLGGGTSSPWR